MATAKTKLPTRKAPPVRKAAVSRVAASRKKLQEPAKPRWSEQYERAVAAFASALSLAQQKKHVDAIAAFDALISQYQKEADLLDIVDRARAWRLASERQSGRASRGSEDPILNGVYHSNRGEYDEAVRHFELALAADPASDRALYALAAVHALRSERTQSIARLRQAIDLDDRNRIYALNDGDFDSVRDEPEFIDLVEPATFEEPSDVEISLPMRSAAASASGDGDDDAEEEEPDEEPTEEADGDEVAAGAGGPGDNEDPGDPRA